MRSLDFDFKPLYNRRVMGDLPSQESGHIAPLELTRVQLIRVLQSQVPLNVYGIPEGVYRPDLLPDSYTAPQHELGGEHALATADDTSDTDDTLEQTVGGIPACEDAIRVGSVEQGQAPTDELQSEAGEEETAPHGSHPRMLELAGIIDARQSILERLPDAQPLVEAKAKLDGSDAITAFASSFASRDESPSDTTLLPVGGDEGTDEPPVDLPEDGEVTRASALNGAPEAVDPLAADSQRLQRVGVDPMQFRHAFVPIVFTEGFPAFPDGRPIWLRADYESEDVHRLFEQYLLMGQAGVRQLFLLEDVGPYTQAELQDFFFLYSWVPRLKAHDIFRVAEFRKIQTNRAIELEDDHYLKAQRLFDRAMVYMESEQFLGEMTPKIAVDLMKTVVQITRMSVGLPPNAARGSPTGNGDGERTELEAVLRTFGSHAGESATTVVGTREDGSSVHGDILADPEATHLAQELIIRLNSPKR